MKRGVTLIELLVALAIATLVGYIAFDLVRDEQGNYTKTRTKVRLQADAREAIRILEEDFANLGYRKGLQVGTLPVGKNLFKTCVDASGQPVIKQHERLIVIDDGGNSSDTVEGRFFRVSPTQGVICANTPIRIRYFVRNSKLIRQIWTAGNTGQPLEATVLDDVVTFQAQVSTDTMLTSQTSTMQLKNHPLQDAQLGNPSNTLARIDTFAYANNGDTLIEWGGWNTTPQLLNFTVNSAFLPSATYRLSVLMQINESFRRGMIRSTPVDTGTIQWIATNSNGWNDTLRLRLPPMADIPFWVSWELRPPALSMQNLTVSLLARLARDTGAPLLRVGSLYLNRVEGLPSQSQTRQWLWRDAVSVSAQADSLFRHQADGLKVWLLTRSRRSNHEANLDTLFGIGNWNRNGQRPNGTNTYAVYERILPVVTYGY